jgi:hypothetical protein
MAHDYIAPRPWRVRPEIWALLASSVLLTVLAPGVVVWRAGALPLAARACLWPAAPQNDTPAYLFVTFANPRDRSAVHGPWSQLVVHWDMTTMPMGTHTVVLHGPTSASAASAHAAATEAFMVPLQPTMSGTWWARVTLQTPGRPMWSSELHFAVGLPGGSSSSAMPPRDPCAEPSAQPRTT